jgi:hypothetical protein
MLQECPNCDAEVISTCGTFVCPHCHHVWKGDCNEVWVVEPFTRRGKLGTPYRWPYWRLSGFNKRTRELLHTYGPFETFDDLKEFCLTHSILLED